jgi:hypothetical protein
MQWIGEKRNPKQKTHFITQIRKDLRRPRAEINTKSMEFIYIGALALEQLALGVDEGFERL